ncbi:MAG TPA: DUF5117 domain-containing protein, partial [Gemmatimonadetes bacterium]|nr:DUF5117 domain-containing protein [Gemmatimonadota bacterium]
MKRVQTSLTIVLVAAFSLPVCSRASATMTFTSVAEPQQQERPGDRGDEPKEGDSDGPREYSEVITEDAVTSTGMFDVHQVGDDLFFEIPPSELENEMLLIQRTMESTLQDPGSFFTGGPRLIVQWERQGDRVILRGKDYDMIADSTAAIWSVVSGFRRGPVLATFDVEAYSADSSAVIDVSDMFLSNIPELNPIDGLNRGRSWVEDSWAFEDAVNVQVTQSGSGPGASPGRRGGGPGGGRGGGQTQTRSQTAKVFFSMARLPEEPMMPRWHDERVGFNSSRSYDFTRPDNRLEQIRFIHRFKLEKQNPNAEISDPIEPIVYWIDSATPDWLKPWIVKGVNEWQPAFEEAGFSNAIVGRVAPTQEEDPSFSMYDARHSVIYWRPSTVANATGGQIVDPRSGQILKGEVNMCHNIMEL